MLARYPERQIIGDTREALTQELDDQAVHLVRGLLLDLVATGDRAGVTEAYERFLEHVSDPATSAPGGS